MTRTGYALLAVLLGLTFWATQRLASDDVEEALPTARSDYRLEHFDLLVMDPSGAPSYRVQSPEMEKSPDDDSATLIKPHFTLYDQGSETWRVQSDEAWINGEGDLIRMPGPVQLASRLPPNTLVETRDVTVQPREHRARSEAPVTVTRSDMRSSGVGFSANLSNQQFDILSNVEGFYEPPG
ncbi:MAG: LPS export ABC transporter periplasmic protein LptC [Pseudomonadota bacterium]